MTTDLGAARTDAPSEMRATEAPATEAPATEAPAPAARARSGVGRLGTIAVIAATAAIIVAVSVLSNSQSSSATDQGGLTQVNLTGSGRGDPPVVGKPAPALSAPDLDGKIVNLSQYVGHPVWLTFGASWCQPCRAENPDVVAAYRNHQANGLVVIQVYMGESPAAVADYTTRVGIPYIKVPDPNQQLANDYRILGIPTHYFIDRTGVLHAMKIGSLTPDQMDAAIKEIGG